MAVKEARRTNGASASRVRFERIHQLRAHEYVAEQVRRHIALRGEKDEAQRPSILERRIAYRSRAASSKSETPRITLAFSEAFTGVA